MGEEPDFDTWNRAYMNRNINVTNLPIRISKNVDYENRLASELKKYIDKSVLEQKVRDGVSVDNEVLVAIGKVTKFECEERNIKIEPDPLELNCYHTLLIHSKEKIELTSGQARHLANSLHIVKRYETNSNLLS